MICIPILESLFFGKDMHGKPVNMVSNEYFTKNGPWRDAQFSLLISPSRNKRSCSVLLREIFYLLFVSIVRREFLQPGTYSKPVIFVILLHVSLVPMLTIASQIKQ